MPENILVVEYEPRYTDRVRQALAGQPFTPLFAKDGEEALRAIESDAPRLIVLSSVVPKVSTPELIRAIRNRNTLAATPILLTVSGYNGKSPKQDAVRLGASDLDKLLSDTLSGQRKPGPAPPTQAGTTAVPRGTVAQPAPPQRPPAQPTQSTPAPSGKYITEKLTFKPPAEEKVVVSQPVFPQ